MALAVGRLRTNLTATFLGHMSYAASQWALLVILARMGGPAEVGLFALALAITAPVFRFTNLDLHMVHGSDAAGSYAFSDYAALRYLSFPVALAACAVGVALLPGASWHVLIVVMAVAASKIFESVGQLVYGLAQQSERMDRTALSLVARGWLGVASFAVGYAVTRDLPVSVLAMSFMWAIVVYRIDGDTVRSLRGAETTGRGRKLTLFRPRFSWPTIRTMTLLSLPVGVSAAVASLTVQSPRYVVETELGTAALGIFASLAYTVRVVEMVSGAMGEALLPRLAKQHVGGQRTALRRLLLQGIAVSGALGMLGVLAALVAGKPFLSLLYGAEFARGDVLVRLMIASTLVMMAKLLGAALLAMRWLRLRMVCFVSTLAVVFVASLLLVPAHGLNGAAEALIIGFGWRCAFSALVVAYELGRRRVATDAHLPGE